METKCPKGHVATMGQHGTPECNACNLIAVHWNGRTGEVFAWENQDRHRAACDRLQDDMDAAFDNQYFGDGW